MLRNSGGVGILRNRLGLQAVVDNHTIDDSLLRKGWDVSCRAAKAQGAVKGSQFWRYRNTVRQAKLTATHVALARIRQRAREAARGH